jgi:hypothetical protein
MSRFLLGLDLGQAADSTGIAVVERTEADNTHRYAVRHLMRLPPGTHYAVIAKAVNDIVLEANLQHPTIVTDITAVGSGLVRPLRGKIVRGHVVPVAITAGLAPIEVDRIWQLPKRDLVSTLQLLLQDRRLAIAAGIANADMLVREFSAFRAKVAATSDLLDWRDRPEDDLVLAIALACWWSERHPPWKASDWVVGESEFIKELNRVFPPWRGPPPSW